MNTEHEKQIVEQAMRDHDKHYRCLVRGLKAKRKNEYDLAQLIGEGSTVARAVWKKYDCDSPPTPQHAEDVCARCGRPMTLREVVEAESQQTLWLQPSAHLPEDDSEVFLAVLWSNQEKTTEEYRIAHCTYYEGGEGSGQQIFADCDGDEYTPEDVSYWMYARALLDLLPAIETIGNTPATVTTERSDGGVRDPESSEPRQQGTAK